jgi:hypothetical protein
MLTTKGVGNAKNWDWKGFWKIFPTSLHAFWQELYRASISTGDRLPYYVGVEEVRKLGNPPYPRTLQKFRFFILENGPVLQTRHQIRRSCKGVLFYWLQQLEHLSRLGSRNRYDRNHEWRRLQWAFPWWEYISRLCLEIRLGMLLLSRGVDVEIDVGTSFMIKDALSVST